MIWTENTIKAMRLAGLYHSSQVDKMNVPHLFHLYAVADKQKTEEGVIVGLLHDLLEDVLPDKSKDKSKELIVDIFGFSKEVFESMWLLKHQKDKSYQEYIEELSVNPIAKSVKISDLEHNMDPERLNFVDKKTKERLLKKYNSAYLFLKK